MEYNSVFITNSAINKTSGGGIVGRNYIQALKKCTNLRYILCNQDFPDNKYEDTDAYSINPVDWGYKPPWTPTPFFQDYMAYHLLQKEPTELAMTYGCPMGLTIEEMKREFFTKVVCDLAPHNIEISQEEHMKYTGEYPFPHLTVEYLWSAYSRHLRAADRVVVHSKQSAKYIKEKARLKNDPIVIPHGTYIPTEIPPYPLEVTPGYFGACSPDKGTVYLATAWVRTPHPDNVQLVLGGRDAQGFQLENPDLMKHFRKTGFVSDLLAFYKDVSFGIFPSMTEGFNIPALECLSFKRPVIISSGAGASELIEDGKEGFIVSAGDIDAIQTKIQYFLDNPDQIRVMGENARKTAEKYSWDIINQRYIGLFKELL